MIGLVRKKHWDELNTAAPGHIERLDEVGKHIIFRTVPGPAKSATAARDQS